MCGKLENITLSRGGGGTIAANCCHVGMQAQLPILPIFEEKSEMWISVGKSRILNVGI